MPRRPARCSWFPSRRDSRNDWEDARAKIGAPHIRLHDLRHTFAQRLEDAGAGDLITDLLHHTDPRLRRRYAEARMDRLRQTLDTLSEAWQRKNGHQDGHRTEITN